MEFTLLAQTACIFLEAEEKEIADADFFFPPPLCCS